METLTKEQIEQKKQQLAEKWEECKALLDELKSAGVTELSDEDLKEVTGGYSYDIEKDLERFSIELAKPEARAAMKEIEERHRRKEEEHRMLEAALGYKRL